MTATPATPVVPATPATFPPYLLLLTPGDSCLYRVERSAAGGGATLLHPCDDWDEWRVAGGVWDLRAEGAAGWRFERWPPTQGMVDELWKPGREGEP